MSSERSQITSVKNDIVQVALPYLDGALKTYTTASIAAAGTALTVKENADFAQNDYLILGQTGQEQTEIVRITAAVTAGTALTVSATTFAHGEGTKVTKIIYNQVALYGSSSATDSAPTAIGSAVGLDVSHGFTEIKATTTYTYYYARYYNSTTAVYSSYSDSAAATGYNAGARGEIKKEFLSMYNERIDDLITDDWLNRTINRWQRVVQKRKSDWSALRASSLTTTVQDQQGYSLPTDIKDDDSRDCIASVRFSDKQELIYMDQEVFLNLTKDHIGTTLAAAIGLADTSFTLTSSKDFAAPTSGTASIYVQGDQMTYTTNTKATNVLSGGASVSATHASGDEVWQTYTASQPTNYTIDNGKIRLYPIPDSASANKNIYIEYYKKFVDLADDADETLFRYPENCYTYLFWQSGLRRRLPLTETQVREGAFLLELENLVAEDSTFRDVRLEPHNLYSNVY